MFARQAFFCISTVLHFFVNVKKYCKTLWKPTLGTSNFESKFNRSQKNLITFVEYLLILFIRIWWRGCFLTNPNGYFFFFYAGWGSNISCKINAFLRIRSLHAFEKSITSITGSRVVCKYILSMASYDWNIKLQVS